MVCPTRENSKVYIMLFDRAPNTHTDPYRTPWACCSSLHRTQYIIRFCSHTFLIKLMQLMLFRTCSPWKLHTWNTPRSISTLCRSVYPHSDVVCQLCCFLDGNSQFSKNISVLLLILSSAHSMRLDALRSIVIQCVFFLVDNSAIKFLKCAIIRS